MEGLRKIRPALGQEPGQWIDDLFAMQEHAREYNDDEEDLSLFPVKTHGMDNIFEDYEEVERIPSES